ncbi:MAG: CpaF family protein, partial [Actinomycetes bacterium]
MTFPHDDYPPPVTLRSHQQQLVSPNGWQHSPLSPAQPAPGYPTPQTPDPGAPAITGEDEAPETTTALDRLRQHLRGALATELPQQVQAQQRRTGTPVTREGRRELARGILEEAVRGHSENELMANRTLVGRDVEQRSITEVINELFGMAGLQPLLDDPTVETINANRWDRVFVQ